MESDTKRIDDAVCHALYSTAQAVVQLYRDLLSPWDLTFQQLMVLGALWQHEVQTPGQLADVLRLDSSSVAGLLKRMEASGLVERAVDPADRRRVLVQPTGRGSRLRGELGWLEECISQALGVDTDSASELISRLHSLRDNVAEFTRPATCTPEFSPQPTSARLNTQIAIA